MTRGTDGRVRLTRTEDDNGLNTHEQEAMAIYSATLYILVCKRKKRTVVYIYVLLPP